MQYENIGNASHHPESEHSSWDDLGQVEFNGTQPGEASRSVKRKIGEKILQVVKWLSRQSKEDNPPERAVFV